MKYTVYQIKPPPIPSCFESYRYNTTSKLRKYRAMTFWNIDSNIFFCLKITFYRLVSFKFWSRSSNHLQIPDKVFVPRCLNYRLSDLWKTNILRNSERSLTVFDHFVFDYSRPHRKLFVCRSIVRHCKKSISQSCNIHLMTIKRRKTNNFLLE